VQYYISSEGSRILNISVVMTTYNGAGFLGEQLESIMLQTRKPDEVIICDDCSLDDSFRIADEFIKSNGLSSSWKLYKNESNKGVNRNFTACAEKASGDLLFFCDQDDVWLPDKILEMEKIFNGNEAVLALNCSFSLMDRTGRQMESCFSMVRKGRGRLKKVGFCEQVNKCIINGMTLAVRKDAYRELIPFIEEQDLTFDIPVGLYTAFKNGYYIYEKPLVLRRVHGENVSRPAYTLGERLSDPQRHIEGRFERIRHMEAFLDVYGTGLGEDDRRMMAEAIDILGKSVGYLRQRRAWPLAGVLLKYNPMVNKAIALLNILVVLFGKYGDGGKS